MIMSFGLPTSGRLVPLSFAMTPTMRYDACGVRMFDPTTSFAPSGKSLCFTFCPITQMVDGVRKSISVNQRPAVRWLEESFMNPMETPQSFRSSRVCPFVMGWRVLRTVVIWSTFSIVLMNW